MRSLPGLLVFVVSDLTLVLLVPSPLLLPLEDDFGNLLKPRHFNLLSVVSKLGEIPLYTLLGHIFVWKVIFLELDEHELIPSWSS